MFATVTAVGIQTLPTTSFDGNHNLLIVAVPFSAGLIPAVQPDFYEHFPSDFQVIFGSSITSTVIAVSLAVREGGVALNVPERGVPDDPHPDRG